MSMKSRKQTMRVKHKAHHRHLNALGIPRSKDGNRMGLCKRRELARSMGLYRAAERR